MDCICIDCDHKCSEYYSNYICDKNYYEWTLKEDKCRSESEDKECRNS
jgi:hypothetical protein